MEENDFSTRIQEEKTENPKIVEGETENVTLGSWAQQCKIHTEDC